MAVTGPGGHTILQRWQGSLQNLQNLMAQKQAAGRLNPMGAFRYNALTNPGAVASWFGGLNAQQQNAALHGGASPFGAINPGTMIGAAEMGGLNANSMNQMINYNDANRGYAPASIWDFTSGGSKYGPSMYDGTSMGAGYAASVDALNKAHPYDPNGYNPSTNYNIMNGNINNPYHSNGGQSPGGSPGGSGNFGPGGFGPPPPGAQGLGAQQNVMPQNYWDLAASGFNPYAMGLNQVAYGGMYNTPRYSGMGSAQTATPNTNPYQPAAPQPTATPTTSPAPTGGMYHPNR